MASKPIRSIVSSRLLPGAATLLLLGLVALQAAWAWDAGTESRAHNAKPGTGGENPISILDTRPKWADSVGLNSSRVADCPSGYTNTGLTCTADIVPAPSILATCPDGYKNTLVSCYREPYIYSAPSVSPICPTDYYFNNVGGCTRDAYIYSAPSRLATCPSGYSNTGSSCYRGPASYSAPSRGASCSGTNIGVACVGGDWSCSSGYFYSVLRCRQNCASGYTNTGETCLRNASTIALSSGSVTCPSGYFKGALGRCNKTCAAGFTNTSEFCQRDIDVIATGNSRVSCPAGYFKGAAGRCNKTCSAGFTNTGEFCDRGPDTIALSNATCPAGYFQGLVGRCNKTCPAGFTNTGETCQSNNPILGKDAMSCRSNEERIDIVAPRCYSKPACPSGYEYFALRCYAQALATGLGGSVERTAVSTVVHKVKQSGNTHLWVVDRALELLGQSAQKGSTLRVVVDALNQPAVRQQWEQGLWDGDAPAYVDSDGHQGTHFYNAARLDHRGAPTSVETYSVAPLALDNKFACKNARECAAAQLKYLAGYRLDQTHPQSGKMVAYHLGLALHYMTDMTQPMHTSGWSGATIPINGHPQWEYYVPYVQELFTTRSMAWNPRSLDWSNTGVNLDDPDVVLYRSALKSNAFAPRLSAALHVDGDAGIVTIQGFNGIGVYTGYNFYNDGTVDALTGEILRDAYQSTAAYLAAVAGTYYSVPVRKTCDVDGNGIVDRLDLNAIMAGRNAQASGSADPRDADGNGIVDANDARQCALKCSYASCLSTAP